MALSGYQGVDIAVNIKMAGVIHDTYTVKLEAPAFTTLAPGVLTFTPANYNTNQIVTLNSNAIGNCKVKTHITAPYNPNGSLDSAFDVDILPLPLNTWIGSTPHFDELSNGDLQISHNNVLIGHKFVLGVSTVSGIASDVPFVTSPTYHFKVIAPDGSSSINNPGPYTTTQVGIYRVIPITDFCQLQIAETSGHTIVVSNFTFEVTDSAGGVLVPTVTAASIKSQGFTCLSTAVHRNGITGPGPISEGPFPSAYVEYNVLGDLTFDIGGVGTGPNATGAATGGISINITGVSTAGFWGLTWDSSTGGIASVDGVPVRTVGGYLQFSVSS